MELFFFLRLLIVFSCCTWLSETQLSQYQQYQMQSLNRQNERSVQTAAFMMTRGHRNTNASFSQYITFETIQFSNNAVTFREFGAFQVQMPGLYFMSFTIRGNASEGTQVQLKSTRGVTYSTGVSTDDSQFTSSSLVLLRRNETVFLELSVGGIVENLLANGTYNSFMGILLVAENASPLTPVPVNSNANFQNVGSPQGNVGNVPFGK